MNQYSVGPVPNPTLLILRAAIGPGLHFKQLRFSQMDIIQIVFYPPWSHMHVLFHLAVNYVWTDQTLSIWLYITAISGILNTFSLCCSINYSQDIYLFLDPMWLFSVTGSVASCWWSNIVFIGKMIIVVIQFIAEMISWLMDPITKRKLVSDSFDDHLHLLLGFAAPLI